MKPEPLDTPQPKEHPPAMQNQVTQLTSTFNFSLADLQQTNQVDSARTQNAVGSAHENHLKAQFENQERFSPVLCQVQVNKKALASRNGKVQHNTVSNHRIVHQKERFLKETPGTEHRAAGPLIKPQLSKSKSKKTSEAGKMELKMKREATDSGSAQTISLKGKKLELPSRTSENTQNGKQFGFKSQSGDEMRIYEECKEYKLFNTEMDKQEESNLLEESRGKPTPAYGTAIQRKSKAMIPILSSRKESSQETQSQVSKLGGGHLQEEDPALHFMQQSFGVEQDRLLVTAMEDKDAGREPTAKKQVKALPKSRGEASNGSKRSTKLKQPTRFNGRQESKDSKEYQPLRANRGRSQGRNHLDRHSTSSARPSSYSPTPILQKNSASQKSKNSVHFKDDSPPANRANRSKGKSIRQATPNSKDSLEMLTDELKEHEHTFKEKLARFSLDHLQRPHLKSKQEASPLPEAERLLTPSKNDRAHPFRRTRIPSDTLKCACRSKSGGDEESCNRLASARQTGNFNTKTSQSSELKQSHSLLSDSKPAGVTKSVPPILRQESYLKLIHKLSDSGSRGQPMKEISPVLSQRGSRRHDPKIEESSGQPQSTSSPGTSIERQIQQSKSRIQRAQEQLAEISSYRQKQGEEEKMGLAYKSLTSVSNIDPYSEEGTQEKQAPATSSDGDRNQLNSLQIMSFRAIQDKIKQIESDKQKEEEKRKSSRKHRKTKSKNSFMQKISARENSKHQGDSDKEMHEQSSSPQPQRYTSNCIIDIVDQEQAKHPKRASRRSRRSSQKSSNRSKRSSMSHKEQEQLHDTVAKRVNRFKEIHQQKSLLNIQQHFQPTILGDLPPVTVQYLRSIQNSNMNKVTQSTNEPAQADLCQPRKQQRLIDETLETMRSGPEIMQVPIIHSQRTNKSANAYNLWQLQQLRDQLNQSQSELMSMTKSNMEVREKQRMVRHKKSGSRVNEKIGKRFYIESQETQMTDRSHCIQPTKPTFTIQTTEQTIEPSKHTEMRELELRDKVFCKYLKLRTFRQLRTRVIQQILLKQLHKKVTSHRALYLKFVCYLSLKRRLIVQLQLTKMKKMKEQRMRKKMFRELMLHALKEQKVKTFRAMGQVRLKSKYFLAFEFIKNNSLQRKQKKQLADEFHALKLKQIGLQKLKEICQGICYDRRGRMAANVYIPADYQVKSELKLAQKHYRLRLARAMFKILAEAVRFDRKLRLASSFFGEQLLQKVVYSWRKASNQERMEKNEKVRSLRADKNYSLKVKAFSSLLFHKQEMKRVQVQKRKYTFFMKNRVFKAWTKYVVQKQEHDIKLAYFHKRWNVLKKSKYLKALRYQAVKESALVLSCRAVEALGRERVRAGYFKRWLGVLKKRQFANRSLAFKYFSRLKKHANLQNGWREEREPGVARLASRKACSMQGAVLAVLKRKVKIKQVAKKSLERRQRKVASQIFNSLQVFALKSAQRAQRSDIDSLKMKQKEFDKLQESLQRSVQLVDKLSHKLSAQEQLNEQSQVQISSYQRQLEQTLKQLAEMNSDNLKKSHDLANVEQKFKAVVANTRMQEDELIKLSSEKEQVTDKLYEEKKVNIKLMKQIREVKVHLKVSSEAPNLAKGLQNEMEIQSDRMSDQLLALVNERKELKEKNEGHLKLIEDLKRQNAELQAQNEHLRKENTALLDAQKHVTEQIDDNLQQHKIFNRTKRGLSGEDQDEVPSRVPNHPTSCRSNYKQPKQAGSQSPRTQLAKNMPSHVNIRRPQSALAPEHHSQSRSKGSRDNAKDRHSEGFRIQPRIKDYFEASRPFELRCKRFSNSRSSKSPPGGSQEKLRHIVLQPVATTKLSPKVPQPFLNRAPSPVVFDDGTDFHNEQQRQVANLDAALPGLQAKTGQIISRMNHLRLQGKVLDLKLDQNSNEESSSAPKASRSMSKEQSLTKPASLKQSANERSISSKSKHLLDANKENQVLILHTEEGKLHQLSNSKSLQPRIFEFRNPKNETFKPQSTEEQSATLNQYLNMIANETNLLEEAQFSHPKADTNSIPKMLAHNELGSSASLQSCRIQDYDYLHSQQPTDRRAHDHEASGGKKAGIVPYFPKITRGEEMNARSLHSRSTMRDDPGTERNKTSPKWSANAHTLLDDGQSFKLMRAQQKNFHSQYYHN